MLLSDFRYALRLLRQSPLFTTAVVLTIALAVGATTAIFTVVNAVMLRPLPFGHPQQLVWIAERNDKLHIPQFSSSLANYLSWAERNHAFESTAAMGFATFNMSGDGEPELVQGNTITPSLLPTLELSPLAGRSFSTTDAEPGGPAVVMIGEALWRHRYAADRSIVGRTLLINGAAAEVIGIVPRAILPLTNADLFVPLRRPADATGDLRLNHTLVSVARVRRGLTVAQAQQDMNAVSAAMGSDYAEIKDWATTLVTFDRFIVGSQLRSSLWLLFGAIACVLLIACANVANLLLGRAVAREREMAVRAAMGAGRARLLAQLLVESTTLSLAGGLVGLAIASASVRLLNAKLPAGFLPTGDVAIDAPVLLFAFGITILTGILFGIAPALTASRADVGSVLKQSSRGNTGARAWLKHALAAGELALATMLLIGAMLLAQTMWQLGRVQLGFRADKLLTFQLSLPTSQYPLENKALQFYKNLMPELQAIPGVKAAALSSGLPFGLGNFTQSPMATTGQSVLPPDTALPLNWRIVNTTYFDAMGIPLLRGRAFTDADTSATAPSVIVGASTAHRFWGDTDPLGRTLHRLNDTRQYTVVGISGDVRDTTLSQESLTLYFSSGMRVWPLMDIALKLDGDSGSILAAARARVHAVDPNISLANVRTMDDLVSSSAAQPRLNAVLLSVFAGVALVVAAIGVYGVLSYAVTQRTREIGLRMALGSRPSQVLLLIVRQGMTVCLAGIAIGVGGALALGRAVQSLVFGVRAHDPWTMIGVAAVLALVAFAACMIPARRASRVDPLGALRGD